MGAIDKNDAQVGNYASVRKSYKWATKVFLHYVEEAVFNAYIIHKKQGGDKRFFDFKLSVITSMLARCGKSLDQNRPRVDGKHYPELVPPTQSKVNAQKRCEVCKRNGVRKDVRYQCCKCSKNPGLCPAPCFQIWHTNDE